MLQTVKRFLIGCLFLITTSGVLSAQNKKVAAADRFFNNKEYYEALNAYKKALEGVKGKALKAELTYKQALCFMMTNDPKKAEVWFGKAIKAKYQNPEAILYLAEMMRINGKYDEALAEYEKYVKLKPDDARGSIGVESCKLAVNWKANPTKHQVSNVQPLNSKYDDFSPIFSRKNFNEVIFTSSREGAIGNGQDGWTGEAFSDLYEAKVDKNGKWSTPAGFKEPLNSKYNDGSATLNEKYTTMFYTRCEYDKNKIKGCQIYTTKKKGNGLGLSTVYGIIGQHNGSVAVKSEVGVFTTFEIYLPHSEKPIVQKVKDTKKDRPAVSYKGTESILLVEDECEVNSLVKEILEDQGYDITSTLSGKEAIEIFNENPEKYDLLISDVVMPEVNGFQVIDEINKVNPKIKIILMSGCIQDLNVPDSLKKTKRPFILKPFTMDSMSQKVRLILDDSLECPILAKALQEI
jgi:CheY-like chemotaxis protein